MIIGMMALVAAATGPAGSTSVSNAGVTNVKSLNLAIEGRISERCQMGGINSVDFGNLERRGLKATARVPFYCNIPFTMTIRSQNGGLAHEQRPNGQGPYAGLAPYSLSVQMPARQPMPRMISASFDSRLLTGGGSVSSHGAIATDGMILAIDMHSPESEAGLLAGQYGEVVTITVSPL